MSGMSRGVYFRALLMLFAPAVSIIFVVHQPQGRKR
jgi:hypothetical protein